VPDGSREAPGQPLEISKYAIPALFPQTSERVIEKRIVLHRIPTPATVTLVPGTLVIGTLENLPTWF
jgi:hypothetical protein